jgi:DNA-binding NtrC family response regulator
LKETTPKMAKIMLTGYPSMNNAINAVNERADAFLTKPLEIEELLAKMKELLKLQEEENHYCQAKVAEFIQTRTEQILKAKTGKKLAS